VRNSEAHAARAFEADFPDVPHAKSRLDIRYRFFNSFPLSHLQNRRGASNFSS
jgi:hypothetical protein